MSYCLIIAQALGRTHLNIIWVANWGVVRIRWLLGGSKKKTSYELMYQTPRLSTSFCLSYLIYQWTFSAPSPKAPNAPDAAPKRGSLSSQCPSQNTGYIWRLSIKWLSEWLNEWTFMPVNTQLSGVSLLSGYFLVSFSHCFPCSFFVLNTDKAQLQRWAFSLWRALSLPFTNSSQTFTSSPVFCPRIQTCIFKCSIHLPLPNSCLPHSFHRNYQWPPPPSGTLPSGTLQLLSDSFLLTLYILSCPAMWFLLQGILFYFFPSLFPLSSLNSTSRMVSYTPKSINRYSMKESSIRDGFRQSMGCNCPMESPHDPRCCTRPHPSSLPHTKEVMYLRVRSTGPEATVTVTLYKALSRVIYFPDTHFFSSVTKRA